jgi:tryptophan synthase alpha chain
MGVFITAGYPNVESTPGILQAADRGGVDFIELGMPFSDPLAEGLTIQNSSERALANGVTVSRVLEYARDFRRDSETPLLLMGYANPIYRNGLGNFCRHAASSGADGLIVPDLPIDESRQLQVEAARNGLSLIPLIAPNTPAERLSRADRVATGFVYAVSVTGLTGGILEGTDRVVGYLSRARRYITKNPLLVGFGIQSGPEAFRLCRHTDGFIVGSALILRIARWWNDAALSADQRHDHVAEFCLELRTAANQTSK